MRPCKISADLRRKQRFQQPVSPTQRDQSRRATHSAYNALTNNQNLFTRRAYISVS